MNKLKKLAALSAAIVGIGVPALTVISCGDDADTPDKPVTTTLTTELDYLSLAGAKALNDNYKITFDEAAVRNQFVETGYNIIHDFANAPDINRFDPNPRSQTYPYKPDENKLTEKQFLLLDDSDFFFFPNQTLAYIKKIAPDIKNSADFVNWLNTNSISSEEWTSIKAVDAEAPSDVIYTDKELSRDLLALITSVVNYQFYEVGNEDGLVEVVFQKILAETKVAKNDQGHTDFDFTTPPTDADSNEGSAITIGDTTIASHWWAYEDDPDDPADHKTVYLTMNEFKLFLLGIHLE